MSVEMHVSQREHVAQVSARTHRRHASLNQPQHQPCSDLLVCDEQWREWQHAYHIKGPKATRVAFGADAWFGTGGRVEGGGLLD